MIGVKPAPSGDGGRLCSSVPSDQWVDRQQVFVDQSVLPQRLHEDSGSEDGQVRPVRLLDRRHR